MPKKRKAREDVPLLKEQMDTGLKQRYIELLGERGLDSLLQTCIIGVPTYLRVNEHRTTVDEIKAELQKEGIITRVHKVFPFVLEVVKGEKKLGATFPFLRGEYFIQDLASIIAVLALDPKPDETVLDCCASPGGKTTFIHELMKGKGTIVANDYNKKRLSSLSLNLTRMGVANAIIINEDMRNPKEPLLRRESFDRVLVDAPCTGEGLIGKFKERLFRDTTSELREFPKMQLEILNKAFATLRPNGVLVYSTCSTTIQEDEFVIHEFLAQHSTAVLETPEVRAVLRQDRIEVLHERFGEIHAKTIRLFPHVHKTNGFFIARLRKKNM